MLEDPGQLLVMYHSSFSGVNYLHIPLAVKILCVVIASNTSFVDEEMNSFGFF